MSRKEIKSIKYFIDESINNFELVLNNKYLDSKIKDIFIGKIESMKIMDRFINKVINRRYLNEYK